MKIGTKSVLFGYHQFLIHPFFVALAWWRLFGFPFDPRLWAAFFLHDIGYFGKQEMDGPQGELHPYLGARVMGWFFGAEWEAFTLGHSRYLAEKLNRKTSRLCMADKFAIAIYPLWLEMALWWLSGELYEYHTGPHARFRGDGMTAWEWARRLRAKQRQFVRREMWKELVKPWPKPEQSGRHRSRMLPPQGQTGTERTVT